jgi:hypothetical protein
MVPARKDANQKNLSEVDFIETRFASLQRKILFKEGWSTRHDSPKP